MADATRTALAAHLSRALHGAWEERGTLAWWGAVIPGIGLTGSLAVTAMDGPSRTEARALGIIGLTLGALVATWVLVDRRLGRRTAARALLASPGAVRTGKPWLGLFIAFILLMRSSVYLIRMTAEILAPAATDASREAVVWAAAGVLSFPLQLAMPALMLERRGPLRALARSVTLTFARADFAATMLLACLVAFAIPELGLMPMGLSPFALDVARVLVSAVAIPLVATVAFAVYLAAREAEGDDDAILAAFAIDDAAPAPAAGS